MARKYVYGDKPIRTTTAEIVENECAGKATAAQVDAVLKKRFPHYKDNTYLNLIVNAVNCNRGHWSFNRTARRTDDATHRHNEYDRLFKRGNVFEVYDSALHGVFEIYEASDGKWLTRPVKSEFEKAIETASQLTSEQRREKLATANTTPERVIIKSYTFKRNPLVVAEVLALAGGKCQSCLRDAPFKREDGRPYLEVHHVEWLANGGEDSVENAIALCPNCHREAHYGTLVLKPTNIK
ncbi:TPA: HNH endonuclease [Klebsiella variicola]|uniref:HNH endonuclease n=1 Tax=Klebsiella pneumoniae TaxID=573 RepID=UPI0024187956|nr:HNH endonuclease [Klebsiella pneumoniae]MDG5021434.1 HNH endonuclease [Klebsiella pneumoniae]HBS6404172.1 HNH endonuclease [Klebsiella pneumoniae]